MAWDLGKTRGHEPQLLEIWVLWPINGPCEAVGHRGTSGLGAQWIPPTTKPCIKAWNRVLKYHHDILIIDDQRDIMMKSLSSIMIIYHHSIPMVIIILSLWSDLISPFEGQSPIHCRVLASQLVQLAFWTLSQSPCRDLSASSKWHGDMAVTWPLGYADWNLITNLQTKALLWMVAKSCTKLIDGSSHYLSHLHVFNHTSWCMILFHHLSMASNGSSHFTLAGCTGESRWTGACLALQVMKASGSEPLEDVV